MKALNKLIDQNTQNQKINLKPKQALHHIPKYIAVLSSMIDQNEIDMHLADINKYEQKANVIIRKK